MDNTNYHKKSVDELTFTDDGMFQAVLRDTFKDDAEKHFGLPCYTFRNICVENEYVELDDKSLKVIYNSSAFPQWLKK